MVHECKVCNYTTNVKSNFKKHLMTRKHLKNMEAPVWPYVYRGIP